MAALAGSWMVSTAPLVGFVSPAVVGCRVESNSSVLFGFSSRNGRRPWSSLAVHIPKWSHCNGVRRLSRPLMAASQGAAQAEEGTEELEIPEEFEDVSNGSGDAARSLLEEFKAAVVANDEQSIANLEAQMAAMESERDSLGKQVTSLIEESQTARERLLRLNADFDNFRKRSQTEKSNLSSSVRGDVIETLLPMVDNFERAKASIRVETEGEEKIDRSYQGIYKQFVEIMKGLGVVAVETVGKAFDPNLHEAIMREESTDYEEGIVVQEFRRGFSIGSKLVRPAMVKVSAGPGPGKGTGSPAEADNGEEVAEVLELKGDVVE